MARTKEFDPDQALTEAIRVFWERGYEATSIEDLVQATGVNRASLYATYGGKRELFREALAHFQGDFEKKLAQIAATSEPGLARIRAIFESVAQEALADPRGCLLANTVAELSSRDSDLCNLAKQAREQLESLFLACLKQAQERGEITTGAPRPQARFLTNSFLGIRAITKMQPTRPLLKDIIAVTLNALR